MLADVRELAEVRHSAEEPPPWPDSGCLQGQGAPVRAPGICRAPVSRKWSGKTLADHRGDRQAWLTEMLGLPATDPALYRWEQVQPDDEDYMPSGRRLLRSVADRLQWENALTEARRRAQEALAAEVSATGRAA
jgi:hypothetical protein